MDAKGHRDDDRRRRDKQDRKKPRDGRDRPEEDPRKQMDRMISYLRENPEAYSRVREQFISADSDKERVDLLIDFATSDEQLRALIPEQLVRGPKGRGEELMATWTTVTVTTVTIPDTAY